MTSRHRITAAIERLVWDLRSISEEIESELHLVSQAARDEWRSLQRTWPTDSDLREGVTGLTEDQLEAISAKVRRFRNIVYSFAPKLDALEPVRSIDDEVPTFHDLHISERRPPQASDRAAPNAEVDGTGAPRQTAR